jgi:hypothetical protein
VRKGGETDSPQNLFAAFLSPLPTAIASEESKMKRYWKPGLLVFLCFFAIGLAGGGRGSGSGKADRWLQGLSAQS